MLNKKSRLASEYFKILVDLCPEDSENYFNLENLYRDSDDTNNTIKYYKLSLNKKTYGLIPKVSDWRWMNYSNSTPWYKSVTILR